MNFIRSLLHMLWMVLTVIPWSLLVVVLLPLARRSPEARHGWFYRLCANWLALAVWGAQVLCGVRWRITGMEHLPAEGPAVLLCKHQSAWETFALPALLPRPLAYVFKRELLRIPFFGWALGSLDMIHIDRSKPKAAMREVLKEGQRLLEQGVLVTLFPEGTRVARGQRGTYLHSGAQLAQRCGAPVIPIAVTSARCWPPRGFVKLPGLIEVSIGAPIATDGRKATDVMAEVEQWIEGEMQRLDAEAYVEQPQEMPEKEEEKPAGE
ncbi:MAG: 1-acyl-sn-glycerol-3-phosphate acyltransferase [Ottowia sp.]|nr:1-acyl-sn-glycerol-3-phosphate acyltransferase [Ottowia sp.]